MKFKIKPGLKFFVCLFLFFIDHINGQKIERVLQDTFKLEKLAINLENVSYLIDSILSVKNLSENEIITSYIFDKDSQSIKFLDDSFLNKDIVIIYKTIPIPRITYQKNIPQIRKDTLTQKRITGIQKVQTKNIADEIFGSKIERSGSISRGFAVGTNKDFTLNSGLRLQLAGNLSDDIEVVAVLSDQSSPIQPEGNTRTLQEIDKVFIDIKHRFAQATFGDFQYTYKSGTFGIIDKKLQGLKTTAMLDDKNFANISYATARGKFKTQEFNGIDGVQGPYRLTGENNERDIIVLAGTEKVFINGEEKIRGENYDYTIDYSTGEIFFTPKMVITNASRIKVDFEYSDRKFERNFFGSIVNANLLSNNLSVGFSYFREGDNQNLPLDISLSEDDLKILSQSGNDKLKASKDGVKFVGVDSTGKPLGSYKLRDTLINNQLYRFYEFSPGSDSAFYNVSFSFVGDGNGDYIRLSLGRYKFVGPKNGNYLPLILLPMPEIKQVGNFYSRFFLTRNFFVEGEISLSSFDKNRFSIIDDEKNKGRAYSFRAGIDSTELNISNFFSGQFSINYFERRIEDNYSPISRINEIEYERNWNIMQQFLDLNEVLREIQMSLNGQRFNSKFSFGSVRKGSKFKSDRFTSQLNTQIIKDLNMNYAFTSLNTKSFNLSSNYQKHFFHLFYPGRNITPFLKFEFENKQDKNDNDTLIQSSFKFLDGSIGVNSEFLKYFDLNTSFNFRKDFFPLNFTLKYESFSYMYQTGLKLKNLKDFNSSLDFSIRRKNYSREFKELGKTNNQSLAIKYLGRGYFFERFLQMDVYYEALSQRSAKLERIFIRVPKGTGQYIYKGDLNNNGIADEYEFEPSKFEGDFILTTYPTDELFPVTDLKASLRIKLDFRNFKFFDLVKKYFQPLSSETYVRVEENSQDKNESNIYLIKTKTFQNPLTTIRGNSLIQQDLNLFDYNPDFNILIRVIERKSFSKFSLTDERRFNQEKLIRLRIKPLKEFANQSELNFLRNNLFSSNYSIRNYLIKQVSFNSKIFYYPFNHVEAGFKFEFASAKNFYPEKPTELNSNSQELSIIIMYSQKGKINFSLERTELIINQNLSYIPFELTRGYVIGKNYIWRLNADYQFENNIQANLIYNGRVQGKNIPIHNVTAEVRAFF